MGSIRLKWKRKVLRKKYGLFRELSKLQKADKPKRLLLSWNIKKGIKPVWKEVGEKLNQLRFIPSKNIYNTLRFTRIGGQDFKNMKSLKHFKKSIFLGKKLKMNTQPHIVYWEIYPWEVPSQFSNDEGWIYTYSLP